MGRNGLFADVCQIGRSPGAAGGRGRSGPAQGAPAAGGRCQADPGLPELEPDFHQFTDRFTHLAERFTPAHLAGQILVVAATDDLEVNALVYQSANQLGLFVNVVDDPKRSSFIFPSIIDRSPIMVAVSSGGKAPVLVRLLRERLESLLPRHLGALADLSGRVRDQAKRVLSSISDRRRFWERAFASNTLAGLIEKEDWQGPSSG